MDHSIKRPHDVLEDVLVKVDKFIFLTDFVVMDMEEDSEVPLILGKPFMKMTNILVNVHDGQTKLRCMMKKSHSMCLNL